MRNISNNEKCHDDPFCICEPWFLYQSGPGIKYPIGRWSFIICLMPKISHAFTETAGKMVHLNW